MILAATLLFTQLSFARTPLPQPGITLPGFATPSYCIALNDESAFQLIQSEDGYLKSPETGETYRVDSGSQLSGVYSLNGMVEDALLAHAALVTWGIEMEKAAVSDSGTTMFEGKLTVQSVGFNVNKTETYEIYCE